MPGRDAQRLTRDDTVLVVLDAQERLMPVVQDSERVVRRIVTAIEGAKVLGLPIVATEQYPQGLGRMVPPILNALGEIQPVQKITFSCFADTTFLRQVYTLIRNTLLVVGVEAHVCVLQTVLDALGRGLQAHVAADAVSSRNPLDKEVALRRVAQAGAVVTTVETALFELLREAGTEEFRRLHALIK